MSISFNPKTNKWKVNVELGGRRFYCGEYLDKHSAISYAECVKTMSIIFKRENEDWKDTLDLFQKECDDLKKEIYAEIAQALRNPLRISNPNHPRFGEIA